MNTYLELTLNSLYISV